MAGKKDMKSSGSSQIIERMTKTALEKSLVITLIYILFGCTWILLSDALVGLVISDRSNMLMVSTLKGLVYVALTAVLIYGLIYPAFKNIISAQSNLHIKNIDLLKVDRALLNEKNKLLDSEMKRQETEKSLIENQRSTSVLLENIPGMVYRCLYDKNWTMLYVSTGCMDLTGYAPANLVNNNKLSFNDLILPKYREGLMDKWTQVLKERTSFKDEYEICTADGEVKWVWEQGQGVYDEDGNVETLEGLIIDITKRKEQEFKLKYLSEHNELTGLFNRSKCEETMSDMLMQSDVNLKALLLINVAKLSLLNITHGYQYSELLICDIAKKLHIRVNGNRILFHISNNQFAFLISNYSGRSELIRLSKMITESLEEILTPNNLRCSIGIVEIDDGRIQPNSIIKRATIAAEYEDPNWVKRYHVFNKAMEESIHRQETIKNELSDCSKKDTDFRLFLEYQAIVNAINGRIQGFEALARFNSVTYGQISPHEFIPIAEETQLIVPLGKKIMREAFLFLNSVILKGFVDVMMSVNISAIQFLRDDFLSDLMSLIKETVVSPFNICIEITESYFSDNYAEINEKLSRIKSMGVSVALDDFGIGYSSLARERELNVDCLKIDKSFIDKLLVLGPDETITSDIISMAHRLGHVVVAEGVEDEKQRKYLIENNCDYMQGYLFSKPLPPDKALTLLQKNNKLMKNEPSN